MTAKRKKRGITPWKKTALKVCLIIGKHYLFTYFFSIYSHLVVGLLKFHILKT